MPNSSSWRWIVLLAILLSVNGRAHAQTESSRVLAVDNGVTRGCSAQHQNILIRDWRDWSADCSPEAPNSRFGFSRTWYDVAKSGKLRFEPSPSKHHTRAILIGATVGAVLGGGATAIYTRNRCVATDDCWYQLTYPVIAAGTVLGGATGAVVGWLVVRRRE